MLAGPARRPNFLGAVNGMIAGLVAITPAAGFVNSFGAMVIGLIASTLVWLSWNKLGRTRLFRKVDDTLGVVHTHGVAGLAGGMLVGVLADPNIRVYLGTGGAADATYGGWLYGHNPKLLLWQAGAAATVIVWDAFVTFVILKVLSLFMSLRMPDEILETGDVGAHEEEAYPDDALVHAQPSVVRKTARAETAVRQDNAEIPAKES